MLLREHRHALLDADFQPTLAQSYRPELGGQEPVEAGLLALATLLQAYSNVSDRDAVELPVMDTRWQRVRDCLGAEQPPFSQGTLCNFRRRLIAHTLDTTLLDRTVVLAEQTGGCGARQLRAALDSPPLCGAGRVEDTVPLLGHALRQAVGRAAQELAPSPAAVMEAAGLTLVGHSSLKAALDLDGGEPRARARAVGLVLAEGARWPQGLEQQHTLAAQDPPLQEGMDTITPILTQDTEPAPDGGPESRRITPHVAPARRLSLEAPDRRHGPKSSAKTFNGFKAHVGVDRESKVIREVVVRPANEPEHAAVALLAETVEHAPGLRQLAIDLGDMARPRMRPWAEPGVYIIARPWPCGGALFTKQDFPFDFAHGTGPGPGGQTVPMTPGRTVPCPARACDTCPQRAQCTTAQLGHGRPLTIRAEEPCQQKLRAKLRTKRGRAARRKRTAVEQAIAHHLAHQGRRARYKGLRKNQFDGRRHAAVSNLQVAAHYAEQHQRAA